MIRLWNYLYNEHRPLAALLASVTVGVILSFLIYGPPSMEEIGEVFHPAQAQAAEIPQVDIYAWPDPEHTCASVGGTSVGYGEHIPGMSHYVICQIDWQLVEFRQGLRQETAFRRQVSHYVEDFVSRRADKILFDEYVKSECGIDTFVGAAQAKQHSSLISHMSVPQLGARVTSGSALCYKKDLKELYLKDNLVYRVLVENFTLRDNDD